MTTSTLEKPTGVAGRMKAERDALLDEVRDLATKAMNEDRGFSTDEAARVDAAMAEARSKTTSLKAFENLVANGHEFDHIFESADAPEREKGQGRSRSRFAKAISSALFGNSPVPLDPTGLHLDERKFFDNNGDNRPTPKASPFNVRNGMTKLPIAARQTDGGMLLLPEWGGTLLGLFNRPQLSGGDAYRIRRQTSRTEDAARFVPRGARKPESPFNFEVIEDRVRTLAVLSEPIAIQDLQDVPMLTEDIGNELANRIIWRLEDAIVNGVQTEEDDAGREMFNGILSTTGVREQTYFDSPFRTIRRSLTTLETAGFDPDRLTIGLNPTTWEALETEVDGNGRPLFTGLYSNRQKPMLFGRPVVLSNKIAEDASIVADWYHGMVTLRTDVELAWSDGGEEFTRNQVRFRADLRAGFNLTQPGAFVHANLTSGA